MTVKERLTKNSEEKYFHAHNLEKIDHLRKKLDKQRQELLERESQKLHWMKCPKCGHDLKEENLLGVMVDSCHSCGGLFLDKGELEILREGGQHRTILSKMSELLYSPSNT